MRVSGRLVRRRCVDAVGADPTVRSAPTLRAAAVSGAGVDLGLELAERLEAEGYDRFLVGA